MDDARMFDRIVGDWLLSKTINKHDIPNPTSPVLNFRVSLFGLDSLSPFTTKLSSAQSQACQDLRV